MKAKVALIGVSGYGQVHFEQLRKLADQGILDLSAVVVINPDQVQKQLEILARYGSRIYASTEEMYRDLSGKLDLVCIPTGIAFHEPMTVEALRNGASVLVEKPAAGSVADIEKMQEAERKSGGHFVAVGFQHIYARELQFIKRYLLTGRLGGIRTITVKGIWPRNDSYYHRNNWAGRIRSDSGAWILDSPINNAFAHYLNLELFLAGKTFKTSAHPAGIEAELYRARREIETFDTCAVRIAAEEGASLLALFTHTTEKNDNPQLRIDCENGSIYWKVDESWNIRSRSGKLLYAGVAEKPHDDMFSDIIARLHDPEVFTCTLDIAKAHSLCIERLYRDFTPKQLTAASVTRQEPDGQYLLRGVEAVFEKCYQENLLPSEAGADWN